jgi:hypothetical protein
MVQTRLGEYAGGYRCPVCGRSFKTLRAVNIHIARSHRLEEAPTIYPGESLEVRNAGSFVELRLRVKRSLWECIRMRASELNLPLDYMVFNCLSNLAAFGLDHELYENGKTTYIS